MEEITREQAKILFTHVLDPYYLDGESVVEREARKFVKIIPTVMAMEVYRTVRYIESNPIEWTTLSVPPFLRRMIQQRAAVYFKKREIRKRAIGRKTELKERAAQRTHRPFQMDVFENSISLASLPYHAMENQLLMQPTFKILMRLFNGETFQPNSKHAYAVQQLLQQHPNLKEKIWKVMPELVARRIQRGAKRSMSEIKPSPILAKANNERIARIRRAHMQLKEAQKRRPRGKPL
jgi:hypothetical protein